MPSKTVEDFAYQIKDYMRGAEVVEGKNKCFAKLVQGTISAQGAYTPDVEIRVCTIEFTPVKAGETYVVSIDTSLSGKTVQFNEYRYSAQSESAFIAYGDGWKNSGTSFTIPSDTTTDIRLLVRIFEGDNITPSDFNNVMICTLEDWNKSHTYEPYYVPVKDSKLDIADQQVLGAWNLCPNKYAATTGAGATWTENADRSITVTGTNTTRATARIDCVIPKGHYWGSGCPAGGSSSTWQMNFQAQNPSVVNYFDNGNGVEFNLAEDTTFKVFCNLEQTGSEINKTFYPMISTQKTSYVPPVMTNRELTEVKIDNTYASKNIYLTKSGNIKQMICLAATVENIKTVTLPRDFYPINDQDQLYPVLARTTGGIYYFAGLNYVASTHSFNANHPYSPNYGQYRDFLPDTMQVYSTIIWI